MSSSDLSDLLGAFKTILDVVNKLSTGLGS